MRIYVAVVLVREDGAVLIQKRDDKTPYNPSTWCAIGGEKEDPHKSDAEEAARELFEETTIKIDPEYLISLGRQENFFVPEDGIPENRIFFCAPYGNQPIQVEEGEEIRFVPPEELEKLPFSPGHREFIINASTMRFGKDKERE